MRQRPYRFCQCLFRLSRFHPEQTVCAAAECQRRRRREYHRHHVAADSVYRQVCNDSSQKWRAENPGYWKRYRQKHPDTTARNRTLQQTRDQKRRLPQKTGTAAEAFWEGIRNFIQSGEQRPAFSFPIDAGQSRSTSGCGTQCRIPRPRAPRARLRRRILGERNRPTRTHAQAR